MDDIMQCDEIREKFCQMEEPSEHVKSCSACAEEWEFHLLLRQHAAPQLGEDFEAGVLERLQARGFFEVSGRTWSERAWQYFCEALTPLAVAACLLLFLWMGQLATRSPAPDLRALEPEESRLWSSLPDAVPPPAIPGPAPARVQIRLVKGDERR